jgi:hypothetical protein
MGGREDISKEPDAIISVDKNSAFDGEHMIGTYCSLFIKGTVLEDGFCF